MSRKKFDFIVVYFLIILGVVVTCVFHFQPLIGALLGLLPPALYLILREKKNLPKIFLAVIIFGALFGFIFEFMAEFNQTWLVPRVVFQWRVFGFLPILDIILGYMLMTLLIVVFYEHFLDDERNKRISKNFLWALLPSCTVLIIIFLLYYAHRDFLKIPYFYLIAGSLAVAFPLIMSLRKPKFLKKLLQVSAFFFGVWFLIELAGLRITGWSFQGQYIGWVKVFGLAFPFEELFFWMMCYAATIVAYYEFFIDDQK